MVIIDLKCIIRLSGYKVFTIISQVLIFRVVRYIRFWCLYPSIRISQLTSGKQDTPAINPIGIGMQHMKFELNWKRKKYITHEMKITLRRP